jgi:hypothetical protein
MNINSPRNYIDKLDPHMLGERLRSVRARTEALCAPLEKEDYCIQGMQVIRISGEEFWIGEGESIHTENSYKYWPDDFQDLARSAGWDTEIFWTDADGHFYKSC